MGEQRSEPEKIPGTAPSGQPPGGRHLRAVDDEGNVYEECPNCAYHEAQAAGAEKEIKAWRTRFANLKRDKEAEMRGSNLYPHAVAVFRYWAEKTNHRRAVFTPERFDLIAPHLKREGPEACRRAVDGLMLSDWHFKRGPAAKRTGPIHDSLNVIFGKQDNYERFRDAATPRESLSGKILLEHAQEVASRVLERAELIRTADDLPAIGHLLIEIDRLNRDWLALPKKPVPPAPE